MILAENVDPVTIVRWVFNGHTGDLIAILGVILGAIGTLVRRRRGRGAPQPATPQPAAAAPPLAAPAPDAPRARRAPRPVPAPTPVLAAIPVEDEPPRPERLPGLFGDARSLRAAVIAAEVLGTPVGLR